jgi:hypothetical protein
MTLLSPPPGSITSGAERATRTAIRNGILRIVSALCRPLPNVAGCRRSLRVDEEESWLTLPRVPGGTGAASGCSGGLMEGDRILRSGDSLDQLPSDSSLITASASSNSVTNDRFHSGRSPEREPGELAVDLVVLMAQEAPMRHRERPDKAVRREYVELDNRFAASPSLRARLRRSCTPSRPATPDARRFRRANRACRDAK